jgi:hypothetical protein
MAKLTRQVNLLFMESPAFGRRRHRKSMHAYV